ncbi:MAG TPA: hypothetical protein VEJ18_01695, partial [Planctomycetota bacterium]|nr:hypothetical protein [Planctomycetota bacterium]
MSLWTLTCPGLSIGPRIRSDGDRLRVRSHVLGRILSLGAIDREVVIDRSARRVSVFERRFWRRRATLVRFEEIDHIDYDFRSLPTSFTWLWQTADQLEEFSIHLVLRNPTRRVL